MPGNFLAKGILCVWQEKFQEIERKFDQASRKCKEIWCFRAINQFLNSFLTESYLLPVKYTLKVLISKFATIIYDFRKIFACSSAHRDYKRIFCNLYASACSLLLLLCQFSGKISFIRRSFSSTETDYYNAIHQTQTGKHIICIEINRKKGKIEVFVTGNLPGNLAIFTRKYLQKSGKEKDF